ncbi:MAG: hypothetical protein AB7D06_14495 [Pedobacter sp.]
MTTICTYSLAHRMTAACLLILLCLTTQARAGEPSEGYRYRQQTGDKIEYFDWMLERAENLLLTATSGTETFRTLMDSDLRTHSWMFNNPAEHIAIEARRQSDSITLTGLWNGQPLRKTLRIDAEPWYQAMSLSMRAVMNSTEESITFWTLRPDELKPLKLKAIKKGREVLNIDGRSIQAQKIEIRLTGLGALLGHSLYWLRPSDGLFLKYQGPIGLAGMACTTITLDHALLSSTDVPSTVLCNRLNSLHPSSDTAPKHP